MPNHHITSHRGFLLRMEWNLQVISEHCVGSIVRCEVWSVSCELRAVRWELRVGSWELRVESWEAASVSWCQYFSESLTSSGPVWYIFHLSYPPTGHRPLHLTPDHHGPSGETDYMRVMSFNLYGWNALVQSPWKAENVYKAIRLINPEPRSARGRKTRWPPTLAPTTPSLEPPQRVTPSSAEPLSSPSGPAPRDRPVWDTGTVQCERSPDSTDYGTVSLCCALM